MLARGAAMSQAGSSLVVPIEAATACRETRWIGATCWPDRPRPAGRCTAIPMYVDSAASASGPLDRAGATPGSAAAARLPASRGLHLAQGRCLAGGQHLPLGVETVQARSPARPSGPTSAPGAARLSIDFTG